MPHSLTIKLLLGAIAAVTANAAAQSANSDKSNPAQVFANINSTQSDTLTGRNSRGPYLLSWHNARADTDVVERNGIVLRRSVDYNFDAANGLIAFTNALNNGEVVHVTYRTDTPNAAQNTAQSGAAMQWNLWSSGQNHFGIQTTMLPDSASGTQSLTQTTLAQFNGGYRLAPGSDFSSALVFDMHGGDWMNRSGLRFGEKTKFGMGDFGLSYTRVGAAFNKPDLSGVADGHELLEASGSLNPLRGLTMRSLLRDTTALPDSSKPPAAQKAGETTREFSNSLAFALPKNEARIEAGRSETTTKEADGTGTAQTLDTVKVDKAIAPGTRATVKYEAQTIAPTDTPGDTQAAYTQKTTVSISSKPTEQLQVTGSFKNATGTSGQQDAANVRVEATPIAKVKDLKISAGMEDKYKDTGVERTRDAMIELPTVASIKLSGGFQQTSGTDRERVVGILNATIKPVRYVEVSGGARMRNGVMADRSTDTSYADGYQVRLAVAPMSGLKFTGSMGRNPDWDFADMKRLESQAVGLETTVGCMTLKGQYGIENEYLASRQSHTTDIAVSLRLTAADILTTGYKDTSLMDTSLDKTSAYLLTYTRNLGSALNLSLSGTMTLHDRDGISAADRMEYRAEAKLGIRF